MIVTGAVGPGQLSVLGTGDGDSLGWGEQAVAVISRANSVSLMGSYSTGVVPSPLDL
jgi:hypothetical protein